MKNVKTIFAALVIILAIVISVLVYIFVLGNASNFDPDGHPVKEGIGSYLGVIYMGGVIVPILIAMLLIVITFTVERMLTISAAKGNGSVDSFINRIRALVSN